MGTLNHKHSVVIILLISIFSLMSADQRQKIVDFHGNCLDEHGVEETALHEALDGRPPDELDFYNHIFCVAKKANVMTENGTVILENFKEDMKDVIDEDNMENVFSIMQKCVIQREDILTTVKEAVTCFMQEDHRL